MNEEEIKRFSSLVNQTTEEYIRNIKDAFLKKSDIYFYSVKGEKFYWKKLDPEEQMKIIMGYAKLDEVIKFNK